MREIKFRFWEISNKKMYYFTLNDILNRLGIRNNDEGSFSPEECPSSIQPRMQFTGLHDKNGKEIYEGDIIKVKGKQIGAKEQVVAVEYRANHIGDFFNSEIVGFRDYSKSTYGAVVEVIGNIYENPELLSIPLNKKI